jgi:hypothetical protein
MRRETSFASGRGVTKYTAITPDIAAGAPALRPHDHPARDAIRGVRIGAKKPLTWAPVFRTVEPSPTGYLGYGGSEGSLPLGGLISDRLTRRYGPHVGHRMVLIAGLSLATTATGCDRETGSRTIAPVWLVV